MYVWYPTQEKKTETERPRDLPIHTKNPGVNERAERERERESSEGDCSRCWMLDAGEEKERGRAMDNVVWIFIFILVCLVWCERF